MERFRDARGHFVRPPRFTTTQNLVGRRFGRLKVERFAGYLKTYLQPRGGKRRPTSRLLWKCRCKCGGTTVVPTNELTTGGTQSCGCLRRERLHNRRFNAHMMSNSPEYVSWSQMLARCRNKDDKNYGGAGVRVCRRWHKFENFLKDMGPRPAGTSLSRFADRGNYRPGNVAWHTRKQQGLERRKCFAMRRAHA